MEQIVKGSLSVAGVVDLYRVVFKAVVHEGGVAGVVFDEQSGDLQRHSRTRAARALSSGAPAVP